MTEQEWDSFARLYREIWKAHADLATLRTMLTTAEFAAHQNKLEAKEQRSDSALMQLFSDDPPPGIGSGQLM